MNTQKDVLSRIHCAYDNVPPDKQKNDDERKDKHVRFADDNVISEYLEPFRPVPDNCTGEELMTAYLDSCFYYKVAPVEFLLEQLKGIDLSICNERYSLLSLRGIRLNRLQVETLEEIFRRVHFRQLDFEDTFLDEQSAVALFDMLLHYETCNELSISLSLDKPWSSQAWSHCVMFMRRSGALRRFTLTHTPLCIGHFIKTNFFGLCLDGLCLRDCNLSGQPLLGLVRWIQLLLSSASLNPRGSSRLRGAQDNRQRQMGSTPGLPSGCSHPLPVWKLHLDLSFNGLTAADAGVLVALVRHQLLIPDHLEGSSGCATSCPAAKSQASTRLSIPVGGIGYLSYLNLSNNNIGDDGVRVLCTGLLQSYRNRLRQLSSCSYDVPLCKKQAADANTLLGSLQEQASLQSVNGCPVSSTTSSQQSTSTSSTAIPSYAQTAVQVKSLEGICLARNGLTAAAIKALTVVLMQDSCQLTGLVSLDLSWNPGIGDAGVELLCQSLAQNHSLKELYLRSVQLSFQGVFALAGLLSETTCLELLDIRYNPIDLASIMALSKTLALNETLTSLLSEARNMASADTPLIATDMELLMFLLDDIDACLERNRSLAKSQLSSSTEPFMDINDESPCPPVRSGDGGELSVSNKDEVNTGGYVEADSSNYLNNAVFANQTPPSEHVTTISVEPVDYTFYGEEQSQWIDSSVILSPDEIEESIGKKETDYLHSNSVTATVL